MCDLLMDGSGVVCALTKCVPAVCNLRMDGSVGRLCPNVVCLCCVCQVCTCLEGYGAVCDLLMELYVTYLWSLCDLLMELV